MHRFWYSFFIVFGSLLASNLGAKMAQHPKKRAPKTFPQHPKSASGYESLFKTIQELFDFDVWGVRPRFSMIFWMIFRSFLAYFGHVFACSFLPWFSVFLVRSSANFAKKIQELAEDKAENPRTCRGQCREKKNPYGRLQQN